jgi:uncharacterized membrane-anchored protein
MKAPLRKGLLVALVHVTIVSSLGAKLLIDRARYPRAWARTAPVDPDLPIRGRYVSLRLEATIGPDLVLPDEAVGDAPEGRVREQAEPRLVRLTAVDGALVARATESNDTNAVLVRAATRDGQRVADILTPVAYFIPDDAADPSVRRADERLWVEVTVPRRGAPRPIRLGVRRNGVLTPLVLEPAARIP